MISSKSPFLPCSRPQTFDSQSLPAAFPHSLRTPLPPIAKSLHRPLITSLLITQDRPQPLSSQSLAHTFRHIGGVPPGIPIFEFPFSRFVQTASSTSPLFVILAKPPQLHENKTTLSPAFATLTRLVNYNSFVCHSCKKHPGVGYPRCSQAYLPRPSSSAEIFLPTQRPVARDQSATMPSVSLHRPSVPRGVR